MFHRANVREAWDSIRPGLYWIYENLKPEWRPEDVYMACAAGVAEVWVDDELTDGFVILQEKPLTFEKGKTLLIWVAWHGEKMDGADSYLPLIEGMARQRGCKTVELWSPRVGMGRLLAPHGYRAKNVIYEKVV